MPIGCATPLESTRTSSARRSFMDRLKIPGTSARGTIFSAYSAKFRHGGPKHALEAREHAVARRDARPVESHHRLCTAGKLEHELDRTRPGRSLEQAPELDQFFATGLVRDDSNRESTRRLQ